LSVASVNRPSRASRWGRNVLPQSIYGAIQGYAGFDRPEWLD